MSTRTKDKKYLGRDAPAVPVEIVRSNGSYLYDANAKKYIDFFTRWCVGNIGWSVGAVKRKVRNFKGPEYVSPLYLYKQWAGLAELLAHMTPGKLEKSFRATGGTEAVEIALQAAMARTKRHKFVSIEGSYHGHSIGAMSVGSTEFRRWYRNLLPNCRKIKPPLDVRAGKEVEHLLRKRDVEAFIAEPVVCNLGVVIPTKEFFDIVHRACRRYGTLFIADEVATGFCRTGKMFASEHYGIEPDIMCLAKGSTGGYGALGATIMTREVARSMEFGFSFYSTFGWHPLNVEAAIANLSFLLANKKRILRNTNTMSAYFEKRLKRMKFEHPAKVRVKGLAIGVEFKEQEYVRAIIERCRENGVLISDATPNIFTLFPPLTISRSIAKTGLDLIEKCT